MLLFLPRYDQKTQKKSYTFMVRIVQYFEAEMPKILTQVFLTFRIRF